jgi:hypothetical protein
MFSALWEKQKVGRERAIDRGIGIRVNEIKKGSPACIYTCSVVPQKAVTTVGSLDFSCRASFRSAS